MIHYDFDMLTVVPRAGPPGSGAGREAMAQFRDPRVVEMLRRADEAVRDIFTEAGFGLNVYRSGAPAGRYPAADAAARDAALRRFGEVLEQWHDARPEVMRGLDWGGFRVGDFVAAAEAARPIQPAELAAWRAEQSARFRRRREAARRGTGARMLARRALRLGGGVTAVMLMTVALGASPF